MKHNIHRCRLAVIWLVCLCPLCAVPAQATGAISCSGLGSKAELTISLGAGPVPNVLNVTIVHDGKTISTNPHAEAADAYLARAFVEREAIKIDLMDDQATQNVASLRVVRHFSEDGEAFQIGYLKLGTGAPFAVQCDGP